MNTSLRRTALILALAMALISAALFGALPARSASDQIAPQVIDSDPVRGQELAIGGAVTFYFNLPMDRASVEAAFAATPNIRGGLSWIDDLSLRFTPDAPLERATDYVFLIGESARSTDGVAMREPFRLALRTVGYLEVAQIIPADGTTNIEGDALITVIFNRPVVPLLPIEEMAKLDSPIVLEPSAEGEGTWLSTSIYAFRPNLLNGGTKYTVRVPAGLEDVTGAVLKTESRAVFTTISPDLISAFPRDKASNVRRDPEIGFTFSQPMNPDSVAAAFRLAREDDDALVSGQLTWNERNTRATFKPDALLDYDTYYVIELDGKVATSATGAPLKAGLTSRFSTVQKPYITETWPPHLGEDRQDSGFSISFSTPMDFKDFDKAVVVAPEPGLKFENYSSDNYYNFGFSQEPSTVYTVTIDPTNIKDIYGTPLTLNPNVPGLYQMKDGKAVITWTTAAYPPEASLRTGAPVGLYSAYNATTRVFSTHRNLTMINLGLYKLPLDEALRVADRYWYNVDLNRTEKLRTWTVKVENPMNVLRYDLLGISDQGPSYAPAVIECEGAPRSRISVGETVIVLPDDPTPLNVRESPNTKARRVAQAEANTSLEVTDGPVCRDNFVWWYVRDRDQNVRGWVAEGTPRGYFIGKAGESSRVVDTGPQQSEEPGKNYPSLRPGTYLMTFNSPEIPYGGGNLQHVMIVATANITLKVSGWDVMAWVTDLSTGEPLAGVPVQFFDLPYDYDNDKGTQIQPLETITTDASGIARLKLDSVRRDLYQSIGALIETPEHMGLGYLNWDWGISPWDFDQNANFSPRDTTIYLYSDRSLYRPGQPIYFRGVLRSKHDMIFDLSPYKQVKVEVLDSRGDTLFEKTLDVTAFGTFSGQADIAEGAPLGSYRIVASPVIPPNMLRGEESAPRFTRRVDVAQYRVPEYQVSATPEVDNVVQGDTIRIKVEASYFFGGAVSNAKVSWSVYGADYYFSYRGKGRYNFTDFNEDEGYSGYDRPYGEEVANGEGVLDERGQFFIELPANLGKANRSQVFTFEIAIRDESDQVIGTRASVIVNQGEFYIGAGPEEYIGTAEKPAQINLLTVNYDNTVRPSVSLDVTVVERRWSSVQTVEPATGRTVWNWDVEELPVTDAEVRTDAEGKFAYEFTPPTGGVYKVYARSRDDRGNEVVTSTFLWVAGPGYVPWRQQNSNRIDLKIDRDSYTVGDEAEILIASPFQGKTTALISVERGSILHTEVIELPNNSFVYRLPITPDMAPNAYFSVVLMKGVDDTNPVPAFRVGLIQLSVDTERLKLNIEITPDKERAGPRETVNYTVKVTDYQGEPVQAEVGLGLTDLAVLSLQPDTSTPILDHFYSEQSLGVRTSSSLVVSVDQQTQEILNTVKGGGGGGPEGGIFEVRQRFIDTPLWSPTVVTDAQGMATIRVELPDQLTTWRLDARAVTLPMGDTQTTLVGQDTFDLISTKPLLIRPVTPRFYVVGDKGTLAAVVNNNSGTEQEVKSFIEITGAKLLDGTDRVATIPDGGRARFEWQIEVEDVEAVGVTFFATSADGKFTDAAKSAVGQGDDKTLPVSKYEAPETVGTGGSLSASELGRTEGILLPSRLNVTEGSLSIRLDRSLAASTVDALEVLRYFPHYCTEQTVSRFLPNLATYGAFTRLGVENEQLRQEVESALNDAIQRLYNDQKPDGGWGWFSADKSNPIVTAYALIGLAEARAQGFTISDYVLENAVRFVRNEAALISAGRLTPAWQLNRQAFLLYALARADAGSINRMVRLYEVRESLSLYGRAYLAMAFSLADPQNREYTDVLVSDLISRAALSATGAHWTEDFQDRWNWNTDTRTTALVLKALIQIDPKNVLVPQTVRWLMVARQADAWETTQETAWAVMALVDWMQYTGELKPAYTFGVALNGATLAENQAATPENVRDSVRLQVEVKDLLRDQINRLFINRTDGDGMLYYTAHLRVSLPVEQIQPVSRGMSITREYTLVGDASRTPITEAKVGDTIRVSLTIVVPNDLNYVVITDPIPAGTEGINPNLATTAIGERPNLRLDNPLRDGWGWWWFSRTELRDDRTVLYATYLPRGTYKYTYTLQAGLAGEYRVMPTTGEEFYFPEVYGRTAGLIFTIKP